MTKRPITTATKHGYVEYLPEGYDQKGNWPLVFFLHGAGELGDGSEAALQSVINQGGPLKQVVQRGAKFPFIIVAPQNSRSSWGETLFSSATGSMNVFANYVFSKYKYDPKRVYVTGLSAGGRGTWYFATHFASKIAAMIPICPALSTSDTPIERVDAIFKEGVAIWGAHAKDDPTVTFDYSKFHFQRIGQWIGATATALMNWFPASTTYTAMTAHYSKADARFMWVENQDYRDSAGKAYDPPYLFTVYREGGHGIWDRMYGDQKVYDWMLSQSR